MKILYKTMGLGLLSACLCLLCAAPASAKVCFVGDENCGAGGSFEPAEKLPNEDLCRQEGYTSLASTCLNPGGTCPYDAKYVKCCGSEYAYQACVFPLETIKVQNSEGKEVTDKCGNLYKCRCNSEYKTPADWSDEASNKCQPGGGVCIMSTTDTVYYNKCTCDGNYFPYENSCPKNTTEIDSCTDSDGLTRKSCQCPNTYKTCTYGGAPGADTCKQNGITLYSSCNTPEQECINAGYYDNCSKQRCYYDTQNMEKNKSTYPIACENSNEVCPYMFGYYFCRWSPLNFCKVKHADMIEYSEEIPTKCTKDGIEGTVIPCRFGYNGEGKRIYTESKDVGKYLGYYRCKLTCEQQFKGGISRGEFIADSNIIDASGNFGFYRRDQQGQYHLYLIDDVGAPGKRSFPDYNTGGDNIDWDNYGSKIAYRSVNGIGALYDLDKDKYSSCLEDREDKKRPGLYINQLNANSQWIDFLAVDLSDINIYFYSPDKTKAESFGEKYGIHKNNGQNLVWKNIGFYREGDFLPRSCTCWEDTSKTYYIAKQDGLDGTGHCTNCSWYGTALVIDKNTKLTFTGDVDFRISGLNSTDEVYADYYSGANQLKGEYTFIAYNGAVVLFDNAKIYSGYEGSNSGIDWDGGKGGTMLFQNSEGTMGQVFSQWNVGLKNSDIHFRFLHLSPWRNTASSKSFGGSFSTDSNMCYGLFLYNSDLTTSASGLRVNGSKSKIYINYSSTLRSTYPIALASREGASNDAYYATEVCNDGKVYSNTRDTSFTSSSQFTSRAVIWAFGNEACMAWMYSGTKPTGCTSQTSTVGSEWYGHCHIEGKSEKYQCWIAWPVGDRGWYSACSLCAGAGLGYNATE